MSGTYLHNVSDTPLHGSDILTTDRNKKWTDVDRTQAVLARARAYAEHSADAVAKADVSAIEVQTPHFLRRQVCIFSLSLDLLEKLLSLVDGCGS